MFTGVIAVNEQYTRGIGSRTSLLFLVYVRGAEPSPIHSVRRGELLFVPIFTFSDEYAAIY